jgi:hypothetical protein
MLKQRKRKLEKTKLMISFEHDFDHVVSVICISIMLFINEIIKSFHI